MLAAQVRSGLIETVHDGAVAIVNVDGSLVASSGDIDRPFYLRSAAKPFQAVVSQESGAGLRPVELALACASHRGYPVHVALVESMLAGGGLDASHLRCPPGWPIDSKAAHDLIRRGEPGPRRIWHNCSGKHAGFLRACIAQGWPIESYLSPDHPLQRRVFEFVSGLGEYGTEPVGVDGCGAPVLRTTARSMALLFSRLGSLPRLAEVFGVMHRYPALIASNGEGDTVIAVTLNAAAKGGAAGCIGVGMHSGLGVAAKSWDGLGVIANLAAVSALDSIGVIPEAGRQALLPILAPEVLGGGRPVGVIESRLRLKPA